MARKLRVQEFSLGPVASASNLPDDVREALQLRDQEVSPLLNAAAVRESLAAAVRSLPDSVLAKYQGGKLTIVM